MNHPCPQTNETLLWLYGESAQDQTAHVASCASCALLLDDIEMVTAVSEGLRQVQRRRGWPLVAMAIGLAAVALLAVSQPSVAPVQPVTVADLLADDPLDDELLALAADVELLILDFENELF
jgi:hypothetical protein